MSRGSRSRIERMPASAAAGLVSLLALATLGQGGAEPTSQLVWHGFVLALLVGDVALRPAAWRSWRLASLPSVFLGLYLLLAWIGACRAPYGYAAWLFLLDAGSFVVVAWIAARRGPSLLERIAPALLGVAAAQSVWFLVQRFGLGQPRPAGTFLNPNHLAAWLVAILLLAWAGPFLRRRIDAPRAWILPVLSLPVLASLALIGSRGAIVGLLAGLVTLLALAWTSLPRNWRRASIGGGMLLVLLSAAGVAIRLRQPDPFRYQRVAIWRASLRIAEDRPWFGSGPRQFPYLARAYQFPDGDGPLRFDRGFRSTHSDWLRVPCELGWPAAAAVFLLVTSVGFELFRRPGRLAPHECGAIAALLALGIQAGVENLSLRPAVYLLAGVLLGPLIARRDGNVVAWPAAVRTLVVALLVLIFVVGDGAPYLGWRDVRGLPEGRLGPSQEARLARALRLNPVHPEYWRRWGTHLAGHGPAWNRRVYAEAREAVERAIRLNPADAANHRALARIEASACKTLFRDVATRRRASAAYARAEALDPYNPFLPLERAGFLLDTGDAEGALVAAQRVLELEPESIFPRLLLAGAVLGVEGERGRDRARELLGEARRQAERWGAWEGTGRYADELLRLDPLDEARLERALSALPQDAEQ